MYVVSGEPVLRDRSGERALRPGSLVAFQAGPDGAHTFAGPGRVVMFSVAALETWTEPAVVAVSPAPAGPCPQMDLRSLPADDARLAQRLHTQTWAPHPG
jgi:hypothetical protein